MLIRDQPNPSPESLTFIVNAGTSARLEDILDSSFQFRHAAAFRINVLEGDVIATNRTHNLTSGGTFDGGSQGQTGDVSFRLTWSGTQDLDLYVMEPNGEQICWGDPQSSTQGQVDVDSDHPCSNASSSPTENIFWPEGHAPHGTYIFWVDNYDSCSRSTTASFTLRVFEGETVVKTINGTVAEDQQPEQYTHVY